MLLPELFHRLQEAGATAIKLEVRPGYRETNYRLTWTYAGNQYGYRHIVSDVEFAASLSALDHVLAVLSHNALIAIHHAKFIVITEELK